MITLTNPVHGTFTATAEAVTAEILRGRSLFLVQKDIAERAGEYIALDGSHSYSDLTLAEALIVLADITPAPSGVDTICTCNFSHYSAMLDDLPADTNPHGDGCPFADTKEN